MSDAVRQAIGVIGSLWSVPDTVTRRAPWRSGQVAWPGRGRRLVRHQSCRTGPGRGPAAARAPVGAFRGDGEHVGEVGPERSMRKAVAAMAARGWRTVVRAGVGARGTCTPTRPPGGCSRIWTVTATAEMAGLNVLT